jgi:hypothetical protein
VMSCHERKDTIVCSFDKTSPKITAYEIHEWIYARLHLESEDVSTIQIDGPIRQVYLKVKQAKIIEDVINRTQGTTEYEHDKEEIFKVIISQAGLGIRIVPIANLPPELSTEVIRQYMSKYVTVIGVQDEKWSHNYRYHVGNGVRLVNIELQTHVPSHLHIEGNRALVTYAGQPTKCYICNETTHMANECPTRKSPRTHRLRAYKNTWANVVELGYSTGPTSEPIVEEPEETRQPLHRAPERTIQIGHKNQTTSRHQQSQETTIDKADQMTEELRGATQKFPKFECRSLTTYRNFYLPSSPSK